MTARLNDLDLVQLSDLAWGLIDPDGSHEAEERTWVALLPAEWPPIATADELRVRLDEIAQAVEPPPHAVPLRAVAAVMTYLAAHPGGRAFGDFVLSESLREAFPERELPGDVAAWLADRRTAPAPRRHRHGARQPRRHFHSRPPDPDLPSTT